MKTKNQNKKVFWMELCSSSQERRDSGESFLLGTFLWGKGEENGRRREKVEEAVTLKRRAWLPVDRGGGRVVGGQSQT